MAPRRLGIEPLCSLVGVYSPARRAWRLELYSPPSATDGGGWRTCRASAKQRVCGPARCTQTSSNFISPRRLIGPPCAADRPASAGTFSARLHEIGPQAHAFRLRALCRAWHRGDGAPPSCVVAAGGGRSLALSSAADQELQRPLCSDSAECRRADTRRRAGPYQLPEGRK